MRLPQVPHVALTAFHGTSQAPDATFVWMGMVQTLPSGQLATHHRTAHTKWFPKFSEDKDLEGGLANWITAPVPEKQVSSRGGRGANPHCVVGGGV